MVEGEKCMSLRLNSLSNTVTLLGAGKLVQNEVSESLTPNSFSNGH